MNKYLSHIQKITHMMTIIFALAWIIAFCFYPTAAPLWAIIIWPIMVIGDHLFGIESLYDLYEDKE
jgi:hypothetical protein